MYIRLKKSKSFSHSIRKLVSYLSLNAALMFFVVVFFCPPKDLGQLCDVTMVDCTDCCGEQLYSIVRIMIRIKSKIKHCNAKALFDVFLETNKLQNFIRLRYPTEWCI